MFDDICTRILCPPKFKYSLYDLGSMMTKQGKRTDFIVINKKGHKMNCSLYQPHNVVHQRACVIYLHSMNGSRLEGQVYSQILLKQGISYCTFDFSGCGNSDGDKITFGANEKHDVQQVINKLKEKFYLNKFILWGRSMGAVSAIKYSQLCYDKSKAFSSYHKEQVIGMVLDSSFKSFSKLLIEIGHTQTQIPRFLVQAGYFLIKNALEENGHFKVSQLDLISDSEKQDGLQKYPLTKIKGFQLPILFLASKQDKTVPCQHSIDMFNAYKCKYKQLKFFKGLHNESRQEDYMDEVLEFVRKILGKEKLQFFSDNSIYNCFKNEPTFIPEHEFKSSTQKQKTKNHHSKTSYPETTIPDPLSIPQQQIDKISVIKLIQERFFKSQNNESHTFIEVENIQSNCMCTMFDNSYNKESRRVNYRLKEKQNKKEGALILKDYNWSKYENGKSNFNCDRISLKDSEQNIKMRKTHSIDPTHSVNKQYHGPKIEKETPMIYYQTERLILPKHRQEESSGKLSLPLPREYLRPIVAPKNFQLKGDTKTFDDLYKPLRIASETSLRTHLGKNSKLE